MVACGTHEIKILTDLNDEGVGRPWLIYQCVKCNENFEKFNFKVRFENGNTIITSKTKEERIP